MTNSRRAAARHAVDLPAEIAAGAEGSEGVIRNLGLGGAFLETRLRPPLGSELQLSFCIGALKIETAARVRWSTADGIGLQFAGLRAKEVWSLNNYFESLERSS